jgi:hypothetical protein
MHKQKLWGCYLDFADISRLVDHDAYRRRLPHLLVHPGAQNVRKVHQELPRGILADILPAEREGRGSEAVHELRNERQLAKRNVLPRKKQHCEEDAKQSRPDPHLLLRKLLTHVMRSHLLLVVTGRMLV